MEIGSPVMRSAEEDYTVQTKKNTLEQGISFGFLPRESSPGSEWLLHHARWTLVTAAACHGHVATLRRNGGAAADDLPQKERQISTSICGIGECVTCDGCIRRKLFSLQSAPFSITQHVAPHNCSDAGPSA